MQEPIAGGSARIALEGMRGSREITIGLGGRMVLRRGGEL